MPGGPDADVVVASRIRLARNLDDRPFPHRLAPEEARRLCTEVRERLSVFFEEGLALEPETLSKADADLLVERSLASRDLLEAPRPTLILFNQEESVGLMVNEEDHFRIQSFASGLNLQVAAKVARPLVRKIGSRFPLARHPKLGYLTACPTNTGSGMRASLLIHLPALSRQKSSLQHALQAAQKSNLAVRGVHGEGSRALGQLYQISNQRTLGTDWSSQLEAVQGFGQEVARYERETRRALLREAGPRKLLEEDFGRAHQVLAESEALTTAQALDALSVLRLAVHCGLADELGFSLDSHLMLLNSFQLQPGHLQARVGSELPPEARDASRARLLRESLSIS